MLQQKKAAWAGCTYVHRHGAWAFLSHYLMWGFPRSCLPRVARRGAARGSAKQGLGEGALCLSPSLFKPLFIANCDISPCYVGAMHSCKAPLWVDVWIWII